VKERKSETNFVKKSSGNGDNKVGGGEAGFSLGSL